MNESTQTLFYPLPILPSMLLGAHESVAGGYHKAFERGEKDGCETIQIFTKNANRWKGREMTDADVEKFKNAWEESSIGPVISHDSYLINLASPKDELWEKSKKAFLVEMERAERLGLDYLNFHPGSHTGSGKEKGVERVIAALGDILDKTASFKIVILIENTAGHGTSMGSSFEEIAEMLEGVDSPERIGACYDTCHGFAAGYDIRDAEAYEKTFQEWGGTIGISNLKAFHLNDSKKELGKNVDRHEQIGEGKIGKEGFKLLVNDERFEKLPGVLETPPLPSGDDSYKKNLKLLKGMREDDS